MVSDPNGKRDEPFVNRPFSPKPPGKAAMLALAA
jgi:hypothetical protein